MPKALTIAELQQKASTDPQSLTVQQLEQIRKVKKIQESAKPEGDPRYVVSTHKEIAQFFGRGIDRIKQWAREGMPREDHGQYNLAEIARWRLNRKPEVPVDDAEKRERIKLIRSRRLTNDQRRKIEAGKFVNLEEVREEWMGLLHAFRIGLTTLARVLVKEVTGQPEAVVKIKVEERINDVLSAFAEGWDGQGDLPPRGSNGTNTEEDES